MDFKTHFCNLPESAHALFSLGTQTASCLHALPGREEEEAMSRKETQESDWIINWAWEYNAHLQWERNVIGFSSL